MGLASFIIAIIALLLCILEPIVALILGIIALILGIVSKTKKLEYSTAGIIISTITIVLSITVFISIIIIMILLDKPLNNFADKARRDLFSEISIHYIDETEKFVSNNEIKCTSNVMDLNNYNNIKELGDGDYYIFIATDEDSIVSNFNELDIIAKQSAKHSEAYSPAFKSPFQNESMYGWIHIKKYGKSSEYYIALTDIKGHGIEEEVKKENLKKEKVLLKDAKADIMKQIKNIQSVESSYYCTINNH